MNTIRSRCRSNRRWREFTRPCPNAELAGRELLALPIDSLMTLDEVHRVCHALAALYTS